MKIYLEIQASTESQICLHAKVKGMAYSVFFNFMKKYGSANMHQNYLVGTVTSNIFSLYMLVLYPILGLNYMQK